MFLWPQGHPSGPGLRLTKLLTVFKTLMGRVLGALGTTRKSYFSKLGLCPCPCLCLWGLRGAAEGMGTGVEEPSLRKALPVIQLGVSTEEVRIVTYSQPFRQQTFWGPCCAMTCAGDAVTQAALPSVQWETCLQTAIFQGMREAQGIVCPRRGAWLSLTCSSGKASWKRRDVI